MTLARGREVWSEQCPSRLGQGGHVGLQQHSLLPVQRSALLCFTQEQYRQVVAGVQKALKQLCNTEGSAWSSACAAVRAALTEEHSSGALPRYITLHPSTT